MSVIVVLRRGKKVLSIASLRTSIPAVHKYLRATTIYIIQEVLINIECTEYAYICESNGY